MFSLFGRRKNQDDARQLKALFDGMIAAARHEHGDTVVDLALLVVDVKRSLDPLKHQVKGNDKARRPFEALAQAFGRLATETASICEVEPDKVLTLTTGINQMLDDIEKSLK